MTLARPGPPALPLAAPVLIVDGNAATAAPSAAAASGAAPSGAALLAAASMAPAERRRLAVALDAFADRLDARAHPLADDFDDGPPEAPLRDRLRTALPKLTAAHALLAASWRGSAGGLVVRAAASCPHAAAGTGTGASACVDPWARGGSAEARRARFLAWPVSAATVLEFADAPAAALAATRLRARSGERDSSIGLVVGAGGSDGEMLRDLTTIAAAARRLAARIDGTDDPELHALLDEIERAATELPSLPAWLPQDPTGLVVIPRLGALATLDAFAADVAAHAGPDARVRYRPAPLD